MSNDKRVLDGTKLLWHMDRVMAHYDRGERVAPLHIDWGLSKFCDTSCVFCFGIFQNPKREFIQREPLLRSVREAGEIGVKSVAFIGDGEPLLNPAAYEALMVGKQAGLSMALSTSGISLDTDEKRETVLDCCEWMRFSLSAGDREGYIKNHRVDKFDGLLKNIRRLVELKHQKGYKCDVGLQSVFVPGLMNEDMIKEAKLAVEVGVDFFVIKQCSLPIANKSVGKVSFDPDNYTDEEVLRSLKEAESYSTEQTKIIPKYATMARKGARVYDHCPAVPVISEISGDGSWFPCGYFFGNKPQYEQYKFGNLHEKSLKEIWESDHYWKIVEHFKNEFDSHKDCFGSCRLDVCNAFVDNYIHKPRAINFV